MPTTTRNTMAALTMCLALTAFHGRLATEDTDSIQILSTATSYLDTTNTASNYKLAVFKHTQGWDVVSIIPVPEGSYEGA